MYLATHESVTVARGQGKENTDRVKNQSDCKIRYRALSKKKPRIFTMITSDKIWRTCARNVMKMVYSYVSLI